METPFSAKSDVHPELKKLAKELRSLADIVEQGGIESMLIMLKEASTGDWDTMKLMSGATAHTEILGELATNTFRLAAERELLLAKDESSLIGLH